LTTFVGEPVKGLPVTEGIQASSFPSPTRGGSCLQGERSLQAKGLDSLGVDVAPVGRRPAWPVILPGHEEERLEGDVFDLATARSTKALTLFPSTVVALYRDEAFLAVVRTTATTDSKGKVETKTEELFTNIVLGASDIAAFGSFLEGAQRVEEEPQPQNEAGPVSRLSTSLGETSPPDHSQSQSPQAMSSPVQESYQPSLNDPQARHSGTHSAQNAYRMRVPVAASYQPSLRVPMASQTGG
jgi:hypothetical protein